MADTVSFVQGTKSLVLNTGDYNTRIIDISTPGPDALIHMPDYGENRLVRADYKDRQAILQMRVTGDDWDDVLDSISDVERWLEIAAEAEITGNNTSVYLQLKRSTGGSTATNATNNRIKYGWVEGVSSIFTPEGQNVEQAKDLILNLVLAPYGEQSSTISLKNHLASSPHFVEDSNADGLADGWNLYDTPTVALPTIDTFLIGGQAQFIETDDTVTQGIYSDTVTNTADTKAVGYIWAFISVGTWRFFLYDIDAPAELDAVIMDATGTNADAGYVLVDSGGNSWYRYTVSEAAIPGFNDVRLYVTSAAAVAGYDIVLDGAYLELGTTTAPNAWSSSFAIENRYDPAIDESNINYIDVALIPGDAPAQMLLFNDFTSGAAAYYEVYGLEYDGQATAHAIPHMLDSDYFTMTAGGGTWDPTDVGAPGAFQGGDYGRYDEHAGAATGCTLDYDFTAAESAAMANRAFKVYVSCRSSDDAAYLSLAIGSDDGTVESRTAGIFAANNMELKNIGIFRPAALNNSEAANAIVHLQVVVAGLGLSETFDVDAVYLMPVDKGAVIGYHPANHAGLYLDGPRQQVYTTYIRRDYIGRVFDLQPGRTCNRIRMLAYNDATDDHNYLADAFNIDLTITPRTRHLLGAV